MIGRLAAAAVCLEGAARLVTLPVPPPLVWNDYLLQYKDEQMRRIGGSGPIEVLFTGASNCLVGVDPTIAAPGLAAYNAGFNRGISTAQRQWLGHALDLLRPRVVVLVMSAAELSDDAPVHDDMADRFAAAARRRAARTARGRLRRLLDHSALVRNGHELRSPARLARRWPGFVKRGLRSRPDRAAAAMVSDRGYGLETESKTYLSSSRSNEALATYLFGESAVGGRATDVYAALVQDVLEWGARPLVVFLPVTPAYHEMLDRAGISHDEATHALRAVLEERDVPFLDVSDLLPEARYFADPVHLNGEGARCFSAAIAEWLTTVGISTKGRR